MVKVEINNNRILNNLRNNHTKVSEQSFEDIMKKFKAEVKQPLAKDSYVEAAKFPLDKIGLYPKLSDSKLTAPNPITYPMESERYRIETVEEDNAYLIIRDKETGQEVVVADSNLAISKDHKSGMEFLLDDGINNISMTSELKNMLSEITESKGQELKEKPLPENCTLNRDPKTGLNYLFINPPSGQIGVELVFTSKADLETYNKLVDEYSQYSAVGDRKTAEVYAHFEISGNIKRGNEGFTFVSPGHISYLTYGKENAHKGWSIFMSNQYYDLAMQNLYRMADFTSASSWTQLFTEAEGHISFHNILTGQQADTAADYRAELISRTKEDIYQQFQLKTGVAEERIACHIPGDVLYKMNTDSALKKKVYDVLRHFGNDKFRTIIDTFYPPVKKVTLLFDEQGNITTALSELDMEKAERDMGRPKKAKSGIPIETISDYLLYNDIVPSYPDLGVQGAIATSYIKKERLHNQ